MASISTLALCSAARFRNVLWAAAACEPSLVLQGLAQLLASDLRDLPGGAGLQGETSRGCRFGPTAVSLQALDIPQGLDASLLHATNGVYPNASRLILEALTETEQPGVGSFLCSLSCRVLTALEQGALERVLGRGGRRLQAGYLILDVRDLLSEGALPLLQGRQLSLGLADLSGIDRRQVAADRVVSSGHGSQLLTQLDNARLDSGRSLVSAE